MGQQTYKNTFGSAAGGGPGLDVQRADMFTVAVVPPAALAPFTSAMWSSQIQFAVKNFPFPERATESKDLKYFNQTNKIVMADKPLGEVKVSVRYAWQLQTVQLLERWRWWISNPLTGGAAPSSAVKGSGTLTYLIPNLAQLQADLALASNNSVTATLANVNAANQSQYTANQIWNLEGIWLSGFKMSDSDQEKNEYMMCETTWTIDRVYPTSLGTLTSVAGSITF